MTDTLIAELEAAAEGSRELDARIEIATTPNYLKTRDADGYTQINRKGTALNPVWEDFDPYAVPHYTTSIDAALTLVEQRHKKLIIYAGPQTDEGGTTSWGCELGYWTDDNRLDPYIHVVGAATPALALCAASLRAMKETDDET